MLRLVAWLGVVGLASACSRPAPPEDPCAEVRRRFDELAHAPCASDRDCGFGPDLHGQVEGQMGDRYVGPRPRPPTAAPVTAIARLDALAGEFERLGCGATRRRAVAPPSFDAVCGVDRKCIARSTHGY
jgi:hypothetical protein